MHGTCRQTGHDGLDRREGDRLLAVEIGYGGVLGIHPEPSTANHWSSVLLTSAEPRWLFHHHPSRPSHVLVLALAPIYPYAAPDLHSNPTAAVYLQLPKFHRTVPLAVGL